MPLSLTADLADALVAGLTPEALDGDTAVAMPTPANESTRWDVRCTSIEGRRVVYAYFTTAKVKNLTWNLNQPDTAVVEIPFDHPDLTVLDPDLSPTREIQIWRNGHLMFVGKPTVRRGDSTGRTMTFTCSDPTWYLTGRYIGNANRTNRMQNGDFETGAVAPWIQYDPDSSLALAVLTTHRVKGTRALRMICTDASSGPHVHQSFIVRTGEQPTRVFLTAWYFIESWAGPGPFEAGIVLSRDLTSNFPGRYRFRTIDGAIRRQWVRLETWVRVPPNRSERVTAHLQSIEGTMWWDAVTMTTDQHLGWADGTDQGVVVRDVVNYLQGKGRFARFSPEKSDLYIRPIMQITGVEVPAGTRYNLSDHQKGYDGGPGGSGVLDHYLNAADGMDWDFEPHGRVLRGHYPSVGTDRTDVTFTYRKWKPGGPERDSSWAVKRVAYADSIEGAANQIVELGGWGGNEFPSDASREEGGYSDPSSLGGLTRELVETAPQGLGIAHLDARARTRGRRLAHAIATPQLVVTEPRDEDPDSPTFGEVVYPMIGRLRAGDTIMTDVVDGEFVMTGPMRLAQVSLDPETEELTLTVVPFAP